MYLFPALIFHWSCWFKTTSLQSERFSATLMGVSFFWRTAQKIKIVVKNKHIISVLIFSSITGPGRSGLVVGQSLALTSTHRLFLAVCSLTDLHHFMFCLFFYCEEKTKTKTKTNKDGSMNRELQSHPPQELDTRRSTESIFSLD